MTILILDDDKLVLKGLQKALRREGYNVLTASSAAEAVEVARNHLLDLIVCDVRMPGVDGLEALGTLREMQEGLRSIVITGYASEDAPVRAIKNRVDDYLFKPFKIEELLKSVRHSLALRRMERRSRDALEQLRRRYLRVITTLVGAFQDRDDYFCEHSRRVAALAVELGTELGLDARGLDRLELAALLHDVGLAYIDRDLLMKAGQLAEEEYRRLSNHPLLAQNLLEQVPDLGDIVPVLSSLRERYDGTGWPANLRGEEIPLESRILAVAEAFDSLTHSRPHREARSTAEAIAVLQEASRTQFDPTVVSLCAELAEETRALVDPRQILQRGPALQEVKDRFESLRRLGNLFRDSGQPEPARSAYAEAEALLREEAPDPHLLAGLRSEEALLEACLPEGKQNAVRLASQARRELERTPGPARLPVLLNLGRLYLEVGRFGQAEEVLQQARSLQSAAPGTELLLLKVHQRAGNAEAFRSGFQAWFGGLPAGYLEALDPAARRDVCEIFLEALKLGLNPRVAREGLARLVEGLPFLGSYVRENLPVGLEPDFLPAVEEKTPEGAAPSAGRPTLEVHCFGRLQVLVDGTPVPPGSWTTRKAQELFALLVLLHRAVPADRLIEVLWPEGDEKSRKNLHTTVSRVRRALRAAGRDFACILSDRNFYYLDPDLSAWVDIREFERLVDPALAVSGERLEETLASNCARGLELARGEFLEGVWEDWTQEPRTTFAEKWFRGLDRLAAHHIASEEFEKAIRCYERMLERETCREEAHLGLMRCYLRQNKRDAAVRRYHEYARILERELGLTPSAEAMSLYYQIVDESLA